MLCALAMACAARAGGGSGGLYEASSLLPTDVDMALAVEDAASWRDGVLGPSLTSLARAAAEGADLDEAWTRFAAALGVEPEKAFDGLLGRRVVFIQRGGRDTAPATWVLVSEVSEGFEQLMTQKLDTAPRRLAAGRSAYGLENGRFWLAVVRRKNTPTVLLGPADAPALFDELWDDFDDARRERRHVVLDDLRAAEPRPAAWFVGRVTSPKPERSGWFGMAIRAEGQGLRAAMTVRSPGIQEAARGVRPVTRSGFDGFAEGAMLAISEHTTVGSEAAPWSLLAATARMTPMLFPREQGADGASAFGPRAMFVLGPAVSAQGAASKDVTMTAAIETADIVAAARAGDAAVTKFITTLVGAFPSREFAFDSATTDLGGAFPESIRHVDLSASARPLLAQFGEAGSGPIGVSWVARTGTDEAGDGAARPGWWLVGLDEAAVKTMGDRLASPAPGETALPWLSVGRARPATLSGAAKTKPMPMPAQVARALAVMDLIEEVRWDLVRAPDGSIAGSATLRFAGQK